MIRVHEDLLNRNGKVRLAGTFPQRFLATDKGKILYTQEPLFHLDVPATLARSVTTCTAIATPIASVTPFSFDTARALHA